MIDRQRLGPLLGAAHALVFCTTHFCACPSYLPLALGGILFELAVFVINPSVCRIAVLIDAGLVSLQTGLRKPIADGLAGLFSISVGFFDTRLLRRGAVVTICSWQNSTPSFIATGPLTPVRWFLFFLPRLRDLVVGHV
jgi:hypothetical protein